MIRAVFFDLYGTLAGFSPSRYEIQSSACAHFDIQVTPEGVLRGYHLADAFMAEQNSTKPMRGLSPTERDAFFTEYERRVLEGAGVKVSRERAGEIWRRVREVPYSLSCFDDVTPTMRALRSRGLTLGLVSNMNREGGELLDSLGLTAHMDFAVTSVEVGAEKPHPPIFLAALRKANARPAEVVHVGDQVSSDVEGARGVGINPVLLDRDGNHRDIEGCPKIDVLSELPEVISTLSGDTD